ncbi:hypothetical protein THAOC_36034, partial [Thalassiosira oceanica]
MAPQLRGGEYERSRGQTSETGTTTGVADHSSTQRKLLMTLSKER